METKHYVLNKPYIVHETIEGETIVMNLKNGFYYSFDGIGPVVWGLIGLGASEAQIHLLLHELYPDCHLDLKTLAEEFLEQLEQNELIIKESSGHADPPELRAEELLAEPLFSEVILKQPLFQRYADMKDVLLLDPIHDVDAKGWPEPKLK
jgi:hypothetical protein